MRRNARADGRQPLLVRRSRFRLRLSASVGLRSLRPLVAPPPEVSVLAHLFARGRMRCGLAQSDPGRDRRLSVTLCFAQAPWVSGAGLPIRVTLSQR